jgi:hypothetical protein
MHRYLTEKEKTEFYRVEGRVYKFINLNRNKLIDIKLLSRWLNFFVCVVSSKNPVS